MVSIEQVNNGYIVSLPSGKKVYTSLDDVFQELLGHFEGRYAWFDGEAYGIVVIQRKRQTATRVEHVPGVKISTIMRPPMDIIS